MAVSDSYLEYLRERLSVVGPGVSFRKMFGGAGAYYRGLIFAVISDDVLYFKAGDENLADFKAVRAEAFQPMPDKPPMPYYALPADVLEDDEQLKLWIEKAVAVSRKAAARKRKK